MTKKELQEQKNQNEFIDKLLNMIEYYAEKTNRRDYTPTIYELEAFRKIYIIVNGIAKYI